MALNNLPLPGQNLLVTRDPINQNFSVIDTAFSVDHVPYNNGGQGQHYSLTMPVKTPAPTAQAGIVTTYVKTSAITTQPELVYLRQTGSTAPAAVQSAEYTSAGWLNPGWSRDINGIMRKWRSGISFGGSASVTINLNSTAPASPNFTTTLTILIGIIDTAAAFNNNVVISNITFPNFTVSSVNGVVPPGTVTFYYQAIGY